MAVPVIASPKPTCSHIRAKSRAQHFFLLAPWYIVANDLTIGGRVKGTIHANRVRLNSTAVIEGDIYHRCLVIEENAQFEGMSRRQENVIDTPSLTLAKFPQKQAVSTNGHGAGNDTSDPVNQKRGN